MKQLLQTCWPPVLNYLRWFLAALYSVEPLLPAFRRMKITSVVSSPSQQGYWPVQQKWGENTQETRGPSGGTELVNKLANRSHAKKPIVHLKRFVVSMLTLVLLGGLSTAKAQNALCTTPISRTLITGESYTLSISQPGLTNYQWYKNGAIIGGANTNTYTVTTIGTYSWTATDVAGCKATECCPVDFIQGSCIPPAPVITAAPALICAGGRSTLTVTGCTDGYISWSTGETTASISVPPLVTTLYTVTCSNPSDPTCKGLAYQLVTVQPKPNFTVSNTTICAGETAQLVATGCVGLVSWNNGQTGSVLQVVPTATTTYIATCTDPVCVVPAATGIVTVNQLPTLNLGAPVCTADLSTFSVPFTSTGIVTANLGSVSGGQVIGVPAGEVVTLTAVSNGCSVSKEIIKDCTCPPIAPPAGQNVAKCNDQLPATLAVTAAAGLQVNWYATQSGGAPVASNSLSYATSVAGTYYAETVNPVSGCKSSTRTPITLTVVNKPVVAVTIYNKDLQPVTTPNICVGNQQQVTLGATLAAGSSGSFTYQWKSTDDPSLTYLSCKTCAAPVLTIPATETRGSLTYTVTVTSTDGTILCSTDASTTINLKQTPKLTVAVPVQVICDGSCTNLTVTSDKSVQSAFWTPVNLTGTTIKVCPAGSQQGYKDYIYTVNVTDTDGCSSTATAKVTVGPSLTISAGNDQTICETSRATLTATSNLQSSTVDGTVTITWSEASTNLNSGANLAATTGGTVSTNALAPGIYQFTAKVTQQSPNGDVACVQTDLVQVTVTRKPVFTIKPTATQICNNNTQTVTLAATLDAATPAAATFSWTSANDPSLAFLSCSSCANPTLMVPSTYTGTTITYTAKATVTGDNNIECTSTQTITITVKQSPVLTINPPKIICDGSSVQLTVTSNKATATYEWTGSALSSLTISNPTVAPAGSLQENKDYVYTVKVTDTDGCSTEASTRVTVTPSLDVFAGSDITICERSTTPLTATTNLQTSTPNGTVTVTWSEAPTNPSTGTNLASTTGYTVNTKALAPGVYKFIATATQVSPNGITNCVKTDEVQITVTTAPILTIKPTRTDICSDNTMTVTLAATLNNATPAPASIFWSSVDDPTLAYLSCTNCANPVLTVPISYNKATITYTANAIVTTDNNQQCTASAQVTILIKKAPVLTINPPKIICDGSSVQLNVDSDKAVASYEWTGSALSSLTIKSPIAAPAGSLQENKTNLYTVKVTDTDGCFASATTSVTVTPSIRIYAGEDATICQRTTTPLSATTNLQTSSVNGTITVAWTEDAGNNNFGFNLASTAGYTVNTTALSPGVYKFWATVTQVSPNGITNCVNTDWVQITVTRNPVLTIVPTQPNICPLSQETITLAANLSGGTPAAATIYWTSKDDPTAKFLSCSVCANPTLTVPAGYNASTISYTATAIVTADNNIECPATATVTIIVNPVLKVDAIADVTVCNEYIAVKQSRSTTLRELVSGAPVNIAQWTINPMVGITNVVVNGATLTFDVMPSNEIVEYTVTLNSAETCYASTKFFGYETPRPIVEFTMDSYVCLGSKTQVLFNGNAKPGAVYTWDFAGAKVLYSNDSNPYDGIAQGPGPHDIQWDKYPGFGNTYVVSLTVTDGGCTDTRRKDIRIERGYDIVWSTANTSVCNGTDGKITLVSALEKVTNRDVTNTLVFTWTGPNGFSLVAAAPQGANLTNLAPGTYHVRVDNSIGGCAYEFDLDIKRPKNLGLNALVGYKATCGKIDGGIHTEVTGGTAPYTFYYYDAAGTLLSQANRSDTLDYKWGLPQGKYRVKVVDANKCSTEGDIVIDNIGGPTVEIAKITPAPCGDNTGKVQFTIFGAAPFSYSLASADLYPGGTITQAGIPVTLEFLAPGDYVLTVKDANGCVTVKRFTVGAVPSGFNIAVTTTPGSCPFNPNGSENPKTGAFKVTSPLGAQYTYTWYGMDGKVFTPTSPTNPTGLATGIYKLKISTNTPGGGVCRDSVTLILNPSEGPKPELVTVKNPTCPDIDNGSVTFIVNKNLDPGTPDKNRFPLTNVGPFSYTLRNTTSQNGLISSGTVVDNTNLTVKGLAKGTYLLTVTDRNRCVGYETFTITDPDYFEILVDRTNLVVCDAKDGKVCLTINGGTGQTYTVSVSPTVINPTPFTRNVTNCLFGMDADKEYIVTIRDAQNCYVNFPVSLTQPAVCFDCDLFSAKDVEGYNMSCDSTNSGKARIRVTGGKAPFKYTWYNSLGQVVSQVTSSDSVNTLGNLAIGVYYISVVDANSCTIGGSDGGKQKIAVAIGQSGGPAVVINSTTASACGASTGSIRFSVTGNKPFTYSLKRVGSNTELATGNIINVPNAITLGNLLAASYVLTVKDVKGCVTTTFVDIRSATFPIAITPTIKKPTCDGSVLGEIAIVLVPITGQTVPSGPPTYVWSGPNGVFSPPNPEKATMLPAGIYIVTVSYGNGCSDTKEIILNNSDGPTISVAQTGLISCISSNNGSIVLNASGNGQAIIGYIVKGVLSKPYSAPYPTSITNEVISNLTAGDYEIEVIGFNGCVSKATVTVKKPEVPIIDVQTTAVNDCDINNGTVTIRVVSGGVAPFQVRLTSPTATAAAADPVTFGSLAGGDYVAEVKDANGCLTYFPFTIADLRSKLCYGSIGDFVWKDKNDNGKQDTAEPGVPGVKVELWTAVGGAPTTKVGTATTDATGKYLFTQLLKGDYIVKFVKGTWPDSCLISPKYKQAGVLDSLNSDADPTTGLSPVVNLDPIKGRLLKNNPTIDMALYIPTSTLGDFVWKDKNDNGRQDSGEPGVRGVKVILWSATTSGAPKAKLDSTTTDASGKYLFSKLNKGDYLVQFVPTSVPDSCVLSKKDNWTGVADDFDSDANPLTGISQVVSLDPYQTGLLKDNLTIDAGLVYAKGSIGDYVWKDTNNNGIQDAGEVGVRNVLVELYKVVRGQLQTPTVATQSTDLNGKYLFPNLDTGDYRVKFVSSTFPSDCQPSLKPNTGSDDTIDSDADPITGLSPIIPINPYVGPGLLRDNLTVDAGVYTAKLGSIGDYVWKDANDNGIQDSGELGVRDVQVELYKAVNGQPSGSSFRITSTDLAGKYLFDLLPKGDYIVKFVTTSFPANCAISTRPRSGTDTSKDSDADPLSGLSQVVTLDPEQGGLFQNNPTIDAGLYNTAIGSIGDYVWKDANDNGIQDASEAGVKDVQVELYAAVNGQPSGSALRIVSTDINGKYLFDKLPKGDYIVKFVTTSFPANCAISTRPRSGTDTSKDSDADPTSGLSQLITLDPVQGGILKDNLTIDAGLYNTATGSIGDYVWKDANDNGIQDASEAGVKDVQVELYAAVNGQPSGSALRIVSTDINGKYLFDKLSKGDYIVKFVTTSFPANCAISTRPNTGVDDTKDSDANPITGLSPVITLDPIDPTKRDILTVDAGLYNAATGSIGDYVWKDANDNGLQDATEAGVKDVQVELYTAVNGQSSGAALQVASTDINGKYLFTNLTKGSYLVKFVSTSFPANCAISTRPLSGTDTSKDSDADPTSGLSQVVTLDPTDPTKTNISTIDAGLYNTAVGSIGDYVWKDANDNGIQDATEAGVANVQVELFAAVNGQPQGSALRIVSTDVNGKYLFDKLPKGDYLVRFIGSSFPANCAISTRPRSGTDTSKDSDADPTSGLSQLITLDPVQGGILKDNLTIDAGLYNTATGSIGDYVWKDANNNGIQDTSELGVANVLVELYAAVNGQASGSTIRTVTTDVNGKYIFDKLPKGDYLVKFVSSSLPVNCAISNKPNAGTNNTIDSDANPITGFSQVITLDPVQGGILKDNLTIDAGLYSPEVPLGILGDYVWKDANNNGIQDLAEVGVAGVSVELYTVSPTGGLSKIATTTTDGNGLYLFTGLSKNTYRVRFVPGSLPGDCLLSSKVNVVGDDGKDSDADPITGYTGDVIIDAIQGGLFQDNRTVDAGLIFKPTSSIGDFVWKDANDNGIQDATEAGVANVKVELYAAVNGQPSGAALKTATTDATGKYLFDKLAKGDYIIRFIASSFPANCAFSTRPRSGTDTSKDSDADPTTGYTPVISVDPDVPAKKDNLTVDAGLYTTNTGSLGDFVWKDLNNNGIQDAGEPGARDVQVELYVVSSTGSLTLLSSTTTDATGKYLFQNLTKGTYRIKIISTSLPAECAISPKQDQGTDDSKDSDVNPNTGFSIDVLIDPTDPTRKNITTVDVGLLPCTAEAGTLLANTPGCLTPGGSLTISATTGKAPVVPTGYKVLYVLTSGANLVIQSTNTQPSFAVNKTGLYTIHTLVYTDNPANPNYLDLSVIVPGTTTGGDVLNLVASRQLCAVLDAAGAPVTVGSCLAGSIGDRVWKDLNNNGLQDTNEPGVANVTVQLFASSAGQPTGPVLATTQTDYLGSYLFGGLNKGVYLVKFVSSSFPSNCALSLKPNTGTNDEIDSDADYDTGLTQEIIIDPTVGGILKDNRTIDAGLYNNCPTIAPPVSGGDKSICQGEALPALSVTVATGQTANWYATPTGTNALASGTLTYQPVASGTYYVEAANATSGCKSATRTAITLTVKAQPSLTVGTIACSADSKVYAVSFVSNGVVTANKGTVIGNTVTGISSGETVMLTATLNGCSVNIPVSYSCNCTPVASPVSGGDKSICQGESLPALSVTVGTGQTANWYATPTGTNALASGATTYQPVASGTYYVEAVDATSGCKSATRTAVTLTVKALPTLTVGTITCSADVKTYSVSFISNAVVTANKGTVVGNTVSGIPSGETVMLTVTLNGCSATKSVSYTCSCAPVAPPAGGSDKSICQGEALPTLSVTVGAGQTANWYATPTGTNALASGTLTYRPVISGTTFAQTSVVASQIENRTTYYVEAIDPVTGCKSATRTMITLTVTPLPLLSIDMVTCSADGRTYSISFGSTGVVRANKGTVISNNLVTGIPSGETVILTATMSGCSTSTPVSFSCNCLAIAPPISGGDKSICQGESLPALSVTVGTGQTANWYATPTGTNALASSTTTYQPVASGTYYVEAINAATGCKSATRTMVTLTVKALPGLTIGTIACSADVKTYSVSFSSNGVVTASKGTVSGNTVTGIPSGETVILTATLNGCTTTKPVSQTCQVFDLSLVKSLAVGQPSVVPVNSNVVFVIAVTNEGTIPATGIVVQDQLPTGLTLADANWTSAGSGKIQRSIAGTLLPGATATVNLTVTVGSSVTGTLANLAEIKEAKDETGKPIQDIDSTPGNGFNNGEDDTDDESIRVIPTPVNFGITSTTICSGSTATLAASGCTGSVSWNTGATGSALLTPALTSTTSYTATCTPTSGSSVTAVGTVTVLPASPVTITASSLTVTAGSSVTLTASGCTGGSLKWSAGSQTSSMIVVQPVQASTIYSVTCTAASGCTSQGSITIYRGDVPQPRLLLEKLVDRSRAQIGDILIYKLILRNMGTETATNTVALDSLDSGLQYIAGSAQASLGSFVPASFGGSWTVPQLTAGSSATLTLSARVMTSGVLYNVAVIPGDTNRVCTSIPMEICPGEQIMATTPSGRTDLKWYRNGVLVGSSAQLVITEPGIYTVQTAAGACPNNQCCPLEVIASTNCCPVKICVPFVIKQTKKGPRIGGR